MLRPWTLLIALAACGGAASPETRAPSPPAPSSSAMPTAEAPAEAPSPKPEGRRARTRGGFDYVTVESLRDAPDGVTSPFAGADVDTVELVKADGRHLYASAIELSLDALGRPDQALGAPTGCHGFVSLGDAGTLRVRFAAPIELGDRLVVHEVDASTCGDSERSGLQHETYAVSVGVRDVPDETRWLGSDEGSEGTRSFDVAPGPT